MTQAWQVGTWVSPLIIPAPWCQFQKMGMRWDECVSSHTTAPIIKTLGDPLKFFQSNQFAMATGYPDAAAPSSRPSQQLPLFLKDSLTSEAAGRAGADWQSGRHSKRKGVSGRLAGGHTWLTADPRLLSVFPAGSQTILSQSQPFKTHILDSEPYPHPPGTSGNSLF